MEGRGGAILNDFNGILKEDQLIDEVAVVPSVSPDALPIDQPPPACGSSPPYDVSAFWVGDHKLAIALEAAREMYSAAVQLLKDVRKGSGATEKELVHVTQAIVVVNPEHYTAWNTRKRLLQHVSDRTSVGHSELRLSTLALSVHPKSEASWAHRRWVLRCLINIGSAPHQEVLEAESKLAQRCAELRPMNYRAWSHRAWCAQWFSPDHMERELHVSRSWVEQHVNDNCGLHYRRRLLLLLTRSAFKRDTRGTSFKLRDDLVEQERAWLTPLLEYYQGREALWLHRRFLALLSLVPDCEAWQLSTVTESFQDGVSGIGASHESGSSIKLENELRLALPFLQSEKEHLKKAAELGGLAANMSPCIGAHCDACTSEEVFAKAVGERTSRLGYDTSSSTQWQILLARRHILWSQNMLCRHRDTGMSLLKLN